MSSAATTTTAISSHDIFRQSFKILNSNPLHFITLSLLFIPFSILISNPTAVISHFSSTTPETLKSATTFLAVTVTVTLSTVAGTALITYSAHQAIYRTPLTFISTYKSLSHSFNNLLTTFIIPNQIILNLAFIISSPIPFISLELLFFVVWGYAAAVSVFEAKAGVIPLLQSIKQSVQFRSVSFNIVSFTGFAIITSLCFCPTEYVKGMTSMWLSVLHLGTSYILASFAISFYVVVNTVFYVRCKVTRGEETADTPLEGNEVHDGITDGFISIACFISFVRVIVLCIAGY